ncbi:hypothetical protein RB598_005136 [Gaeumannomyces tritici]
MVDRRRRRERHNWSTFELNAAIALICKGKHKVRPSSNSGFAFELNKALNSQRANFHEGDMDEADIEDLLRFLLAESKPAVAYAERAAPACITRAKRMAFKRRIDFSGSEAEWVAGGRRDAVMGRPPGRGRRRAELPSLRAKGGGEGEGEGEDGGDEAGGPDGLEMGELRERGPQGPIMLNLPSLREAVGEVYHTSNPGNSHLWNTQGSNITLPSLKDQPWASYGSGGGQPSLQRREPNRATEALPSLAAAVAGNAKDGLGGRAQQGLTSRLGDGHATAAAAAGGTYPSPYMSVNTDDRISSRHNSRRSMAPSPLFQNIGVGDDVSGGGMGSSSSGRRATWGNVMSLPVGPGGYGEKSRPGPSGASTHGAQATRWTSDAMGSVMGTTSAASTGHGPSSGNGQGLWSGDGTSHVANVGGRRDQPDGLYDASTAGAHDPVVPGSNSFDTLHSAQPMARPNAAAGPSSSSLSADWGGNAQYDSGSYRNPGVTNTEAQQLQYKPDGRYGSSGATTSSRGGASAAACGIESGRSYPAAAHAAHADPPPRPPVGAAAAGPSGGNVAEASSSTAQGGGWRLVTGAGGYMAGDEQQETALPASHAVTPQPRQQ